MFLDITYQCLIYILQQNAKILDITVTWLQSIPVAYSGFNMAARDRVDYVFQRK